MRAFLAVLLLVASAARAQDAKESDAPRALDLSPHLSRRDLLLDEILSLRMERDDTGIAAPIVFASVGGIFTMASLIALGQPSYNNPSALLAAVGVPTLLVSSIVLGFRVSHRGRIDGELRELEFQAARLGVLVPRDE
jgi:hypothetical protein